MPHLTPPAYVLEHRSSDDVEPALRHEAWCEIAHRWVDVHPAPEIPLKAKLSTLGGTRSSAYEMRTGSQGAQPDDIVVLTLLQSGHLLSQAYPRKGPSALNLCAPRSGRSLPPSCLARAARWRQRCPGRSMPSCCCAQARWTPPNTQGYSRRRLYESFAMQGQTVMGVLRDIHLPRTQRLNVGGLAWRCGFANPSDFSKLFRARFGLSPTEWHQRAWGR